MGPTAVSPAGVTSEARQEVDAWVSGSAESRRARRITLTLTLTFEANIAGPPSALGASSSAAVSVSEASSVRSLVSRSSLADVDVDDDPFGG